MSDSTPLHDLLTEMVQAYSQKNQPPHIPTPAEIGTHLHPLLDRMCAEAESRNASDIFISAGFPPAMKVSGVLSPVPHKALTGEETAAIVESTMNPEQLEAFNQNWEINYSVQSRSNRRYRAHAHPEHGRVGLVSRRINQKIPEIDELGLPPKLKDLALTPRGMLILAGPTGSGKSTTMASMLDYRNNKVPGHIVTIEDPIEYVFEAKESIIDQKELWKDISSFSSAMKYALRQRPDIILFGEIRDLDGIRNAILLSETGHLVLTTVHARSAEQVLNKLIGSFSSSEQNQIRVQLAENLCAIIVQKLLKRQDKPGLALAQEILLNTTAVSNLVRENKLNQLKSTMYTNRMGGMQIMEESLLSLVEKGMITVSQAIQAANNPEYVQRELITRELVENK